MRYYVVSDVHSFYTEMIKALTEKGYFDDKEPHKLIICGDMFDRGSESVAMQKFIMELLEKDEVKTTLLLPPLLFCFRSYVV